LNQKTDAIFIKPDSKVASLYQSDKVEEEYYCSFGVNPKYLSIYDNSDMTFTGKDDSGEPRILEISNHPFFIGTAYQPERSALKDRTHPIVVEFLKVANEKYLTP